MSYYLLSGVLFGLAAGFSPGPLLALVISETLEHGIRSGIKVALAPVITDIPIILIALFAFSRLSGFDSILGIISVLGGCYVLYMGYQSILLNSRNTQSTEIKPKSLTRGVLTNALSPHPYLFWISVGAPTVTKSDAIDTAAPFLFIAGFYVFLVGTKIALAILVGKSKSFMSDNAYRYSLKFLGFALLVFSVVLFADGIKLLGF
ncbi:MAG: LysE family translocator [Gammaproteobacteria bacterium]|nr:LysE family translocator [Gammaproteobacteria bacterium]